MEIDRSKGSDTYGGQLHAGVPAKELDGGTCGGLGRRGLNLCGGQIGRAGADAADELSTACFNTTEHVHGVFRSLPQKFLAKFRVFSVGW